ncbi:S41 family peptidase [Spongiimicrobium salis]|uniref:S41 family peptidase n=1 Tax=Spongiimicrobium salis TaxID=1667022 RepID=UPI00374D5126
MKSSILQQFNTHLKVLIGIFLCIGGLHLNAQESECNCRADFEFLHQKLKKTPAYRHQTEKETSYTASYRALQGELQAIKSPFECYFLLNKLVLSLKDNHMQVYGKKNGMSTQLLKDSIGFMKFKRSKAYRVLPRLSMDLDSLETVLKTKPFESKEGIYYRKDYLKIGVYWDKSRGAFNSLVLSSKTPLWEPGELFNSLIPYGQNNLRAIGGGITTKRLITYAERIQEGLFLTMRFQKDLSKSNFSVAPYPKLIYKREALSPDITYLKLGDFDSFYPVLSDAEAFYALLKGTLQKPNLVVDLRDNGGGGDRNSNIVFKILKKYSKTNSIFVLINQRTGSNAEQFAFKLRKMAKAVVLGDQSRGVVAYEIKNSTYTLPSAAFIAQLTSKKHAKYLELESVGLTPDVFLDYEKSWLTQVKEYIETKK